MKLSYQSFKAREAQVSTFHPYYLKEYRNRWFVLGIRKRSQPVLLLLALDRIMEVGESHEPYLENEGLIVSGFYTFNPFTQTLNISSSLGLELANKLVLTNRVGQRLAERIFVWPAEDVASPDDEFCYAFDRVVQ